jgi:hypothetical protein
VISVEDKAPIAACVAVPVLLFPVVAVLLEAVAAAATPEPLLSVDAVLLDAVAPAAAPEPVLSVDAVLLDAVAPEPALSDVALDEDAIEALVVLDVELLATDPELLVPEEEVAPLAARRESKSLWVVHVVRVPVCGLSTGIAAHIVPAAQDCKTNLPFTHCANLPVTHASSPVVQEEVAVKVSYWALSVMAVWPFFKAVASRRILGRAEAVIPRASATRTTRMMKMKMTVV